MTINTALSLIYTLSTPTLHTHYDSQSSLVVSWKWITTQKIAIQITMKSSCHFLFNHPGTLELTTPAYCSPLQNTTACKRLLLSSFKPSAQTYRKHVVWSLSTVVWRHRLRRSVFTYPLPTSGLRNPRCSIVACMYYLETAVSVAQPFLPGANTPQFEGSLGYVCFLKLIRSNVSAESLDFHLWRLRQQIPLEHWYLPTKLHGVSYYNTFIFNNFRLCYNQTFRAYSFLSVFQDLLVKHKNLPEKNRLLYNEQPRFLRNSYEMLSYYTS
jgi:hypothetical protein